MKRAGNKWGEGIVDDKRITDIFKEEKKNRGREM